MLRTPLPADRNRDGSLDLEAVLDAARGQIRKLHDWRLGLPPEVPYTEPHNTWPLTFVEQWSLAELTAELSTSCYAGTLMLQAMGLGGWMFNGLDPFSVLGASGTPEVPGRGFRYDTRDGWLYPNPTGLLGIMEGYCPPHHRDKLHLICSSRAGNLRGINSPRGSCSMVITTTRRTLPMLVLMALLFALPPKASAGDDLARAVLTELNAARANPKAYAEHLRVYRSQFSGKYHIPPGTKIRYITKEGPKAVDEAVCFLERQRPLSTLGWAEGLAHVAAELVRDQAKTGAIGHGSGRMEMRARAERVGRWQSTIGENISYGPDDARRVAMQLIVDDGMPDRGHRKNIFTPDFRVAGIACGPHPVFETSCVIDFAGWFSER
nr:CAP domain-containing protein [Geobacter sp.]